MLTTSYKARHDENRMAHEGDTENARTRYYSEERENLKFLLENRFEWMNQYIRSTDRGLEVGCGTGISKDFIKAHEFLLTDYTNKPWLDVPHVDALDTPFRAEEFDFVVSSNMIHHVPYPTRFFSEMARILKPGGYLLVQEINASIMMRFLLRLMRHEGYAFNIDVFDHEVICTDPDDLWSANCAIPNLLFDNESKFHSNVSEFKIIYQSYSEFLNFINSGGVIAKTVSLPLPRFALRVFKNIDDFLTSAAPKIFALQRQVVLQKV